MDGFLTFGDPAITHVFEPVVTDDEGVESTADRVTITISPPVDGTAPTGALVGSKAKGGFLIEPELRLTHFRETIDAYTDGLGYLIPSYEVATGSVEFGPNVSRSFVLDNGLTVTSSVALKRSGRSIMKIRR